MKRIHDGCGGEVVSNHPFLRGYLCKKCRATTLRVEVILGDPIRLKFLPSPLDN